MSVSDQGTGSAPSLAQLAPVLAAGGPRLAELLGRSEERLAEIMRASGEALGRFAADTLAAGGKRLRPILVFLCGDETTSDGLVRAGTAVELVHMATLVHDDVLDRASLRRGRPTVYLSGGRPAATATGDVLFSRAFAELATTANVEAVQALSEASSALARGELLQRADAWSDAVTAERYLERCELKTARLFEAACRLGAIFAPSGRASIEAIAGYGRRIGLAFQVFDDVLDVAGPTERTGKSRGADLLDGTVTLPFILARRRDPGLRGVDLRAGAGDAAAAAALCDRIALTGALDESRELALRYVREAKAALGDLAVSARARSALELVADGVVERYA